MSNANCDMETLGRVVTSFDSTKRRIVFEMGFRNLLYVTRKRLPRHLSYWIATRVDVKNKTLLAVDGKQIQLNVVQVCWVLGLPKGKKPLPKNCVDEALETYLYDKYNIAMGHDTSGIYRTTLINAVEAPLFKEEEFKQVFELLVMNILCSSSYHRVSKRQMHPVKVAADQPKKYDWCSLVLDELLHALRNFSHRFYAEGWAPCLGGCTYFLSDPPRSFRKLFKQKTDEAVDSPSMSQKVSSIQTAPKLPANQEESALTPGSGDHERKKEEAEKKKEEALANSTQPHVGETGNGAASVPVN
uniref:Uncharacterized protein n=1 Tax=Chenopodium quinoa TaxID=63459 RepID=A0A803N0W7_CHEQI